MKRTFYYDEDLDMVCERGSNYFEEPKQGPSVISDDIGAGVNGLRAMHRTDKRHFDSKSSYRADVKAAGLHEVGNQTDFASTPPSRPKGEYGRIVQDAYRQYEGNYNGIADRVNAVTRRNQRS